MVQNSARNWVQTVFISVLLVLSASSALAHDAFPVGPDAVLTPGALCQRPNSLRYPEKIPYCNRRVDQRTKAAVFSAYDQLGYRTKSMQRSNFKIDHYIPLCMGGSNDPSNLWPQHMTVYSVTDPLEEKICLKMAEGLMSQRDAIVLLKKGKADLSLVEGILEQLDELQ